MLLRRIVAEFEALDRVRSERETVGAAQPADACKVKVAVSVSGVARAISGAGVCAGIAGFEVASVDSRVVGINFVQPEDSYGSMSQYSRQMKMIAYLHSVYPKVHISLHAGELAMGWFR